MTLTQCALLFGVIAVGLGVLVLCVMSWTSAESSMGFIEVWREGSGGERPSLIVDPDMFYKAVMYFVITEMVLFLTTFYMWCSRKEFNKRPLWILPMFCLVILGVLFFVVSKVWADRKFSAFWMSDCSEYRAAEMKRLQESSVVLKRVAASQQSGSHRGGNDIYVAVIVGRERPQHYFTQTITTLLGGLAQDELNRLSHVEVLVDGTNQEIKALSLRLLEPLVQVIYNDRFRNRFHRIHYVHALERCAASKATLCLVLADDVAAGQHWIRAVDRAINELGVRYGKEGSWTMLKLFQPVWGDVRQQWSGVFLLRLSIASCFLGGIPGFMSGWFLRSCLLPPEWFWVMLWTSLWQVLVAQLLYAIGKPNVNYFFGDGFVHPYGTNHMEQANLFLRRQLKASGLTEFLKHYDTRSVDVLIANFFEERPAWGPIWATTPCVFQHIGLFTSLPKGAFRNVDCPIEEFHDGLWMD